MNQWKWKDNADYWSKYGQNANEEAFVTSLEVLWYFEGVGQLLRDGLIDVGLVEAMYSDRVIRLMEKFRPIFEGLRDGVSVP